MSDGRLEGVEETYTDQLVVGIEAEVAVTITVAEAEVTSGGNKAAMFIDAESYTRTEADIVHDFGICVAYLVATYSETAVNEEAGDAGTSKSKTSVGRDKDVLSLQGVGIQNAHTSAAERETEVQADSPLVAEVVAHRGSQGELSLGVKASALLIVKANSSTDPYLCVSCQCSDCENSHQKNLFHNTVFNHFLPFLLFSGFSESPISSFPISGAKVEGLDETAK